MAYQPQFYCFSKKCGYYINQQDKLISHYMSKHNWTHDQASKKTRKTEPKLTPPRKAVI